MLRPVVYCTVVLLYMQIRPPEAEVRGSNPLGCAIKINELS